MKRFVALLLLAACAAPPEEPSDWELKHLAAPWQEQKVTLPLYPANASLVEFSPTASGGFRFFIDSGSLAVGGDGVVRYVLVARSPDGVDNVSFEGLRCATGEYRIYAVGHRDRSWTERGGTWQSVSVASGQLRRELRDNYFCRYGQPVRDRDEGLRMLRQGGWKPDG